MVDPEIPPAPPRRRGRLRRCARWTIRLLLALVVLVEAVYLARRPLLERLICSQVSELLGPALGGKVELGALRGDWITRLRIEGLTLRTEGLLREVSDASVDVQLDPWALAHGDLAGLVRARVRVAACTLDLTAPGGPEAEPAPTSEGVFDLGALTSLLPRGTRVEVGAFTLIGADARIEGAVDVHLAPAQAGRPRRVLVHGPGVLADAELGGDGKIHAGFAVRDLSRVPRLFVPLSELVGGDVSGQATLVLAPAFAVDAKVRVRDLRAAGQLVEDLHAATHLDADGLRGLDAALVAPGVRIAVEDAGFAFTNVPGTARGRTLVDLRDVTAYADLLPEALRAQMPITGWLQARAEDGLLTIGDGRVQSAGAAVELQGGAIALDGETLLAAASPVRFSLRLLDPATLPLGPDLPVRPTAGEVVGELSQRPGVVVLDASVRADVVDGQGNTGQARGRVRLEAGADLRLSPTLRVEGPILRDLGKEANFDGTLVIAGQTLGIEKLAIGFDAQPDVLRVAGTLPLGGSVGELIAAADVRIDFAALPLAPVFALGGLAPARGQLTGHVSCAGGAVVIELDTVVEELAAAPDLTVRTNLSARGDDAGLTLTRFDVICAAGHVRAQGKLTGQSLRQLLDEGAQPASLRPDLTLDLEVAGLERFALLPIVGVSAAGDLRVQGSVGGTLAAPLPTAEVSITALALSDAAGQTLVRAVTGQVVLEGDAVRVTKLDAEIDGHALTLSGEVRREDDGISVRELFVRDTDGGSLRADGRVPRLLSVPWQDAIAGANLDLSLIRYSLTPWLTLAGIQSEGAQAEGTLALRPGPQLALDLKAHAASVTASGQTFSPTFSLAARTDADGTHLEVLKLDLGEVRVEGRGNLALTPTQAVADAALARDAAVTATIEIPAAKLGAIPPALLGLADLQGELGITIEVSGRASAPQLTAKISLDGGRVVTTGGQRIDDLVVRLACTPTAIEVTEISATRGKGPLRITGAFTAPGPLWERWADGQIDLLVKGDNVLLHRKTGVKVRADLDVRVQGPLADFAITGDIGLRDGRMVTRLPLLDLRSSGGQAATAGIPLPSIDLGEGRRARLDLRVKSLEPFVVKNNVLDGALHIQLSVLGDLAQPILQGTVSGAESTLILPGVRLRASTLLVDFSAQNPRFPTVTATARGRRHGFDIQAVVRGRYDRPEILLSSDPPLPSDELIVLVTTGARPQTLGVQGVGTVLGAYLAQELADWIFGSESTEAKESFLERFTVETGTEMSRGGTESVIVEFRVLDQVYLQGERDVYEDLNMGVVYRVRFK